jgi:hypothetical protein
MNGLPSFVLALSLVIVLIAGTDAGTVPNDSGKAVSRQRRSAAITFPSMTILRVVLDAFIPVIPLLNSTLTYLNFNMPFRITVPTYKQMIDLYSSLGRMEEHGILLDHNFLDEHRANQDRRSIYKLVEGLFDRSVHTFK